MIYKVLTSTKNQGAVINDNIIKLVLRFSFQILGKPVPE